MANKLFNITDQINTNLLVINGKMVEVIKFNVLTI